MKHKMQRGLGMELAMAAICSAVVGLALFWCLSSGAYAVLNRAFMNPEIIARQDELYISKLQAYVSEKQLKLEDAKLLKQWNAKEKNILYSLYHNGKFIYSSNENVAVAAQDMIYWNEGVSTSISLEEIGYPVEFSDGTAWALLNNYFEGGYYYLADAVSGVLAMGAFVMLLFLFIRKKVRYIVLLENELKILKGGDLDYPVTVLGHDELSDMAMEIDAMRRAIKERQDEKQMAREANHQLVTAMSHDLRTPLTALIGYIDILKMGRFEGAEQQNRYIAAAGDKAYQIKALSDKLFEYFVVYGKEQEEVSLLEVNGAEFIGQVVEESLFDLESEGFIIERVSDVIDCCLMVDVELIRRVFGNIFSNLLKYADRTRPVCVEYKQQADRLTVCFANFMKEDTGKKESSSIGMKTCDKIMRDHKGSFLWTIEREQFRVEVSFAIM